jgi:hypothetical protein
VRTGPSSTYLASLVSPDVSVALMK